MEARPAAADWPATMTTLSTHDTKRQEDVRARLAVLAERPAWWGRGCRAVARDVSQSLGRHRARRRRRYRVPDLADSGGRLAHRRRSDWPGTWKRRCARPRPGPRGSASTAVTRRRCRAGDAILADDALATRSAVRRHHGPPDAMPSRSASSSSSSPCPACPTSTRAASWRGCPWSTRTTAAPWTSPAPWRCSPAWTAARARPLILPRRAIVRKLLVTSRALRLRRDHPGLVRRRSHLPRSGATAPRPGPRGRVRPRRRTPSRVATRLPGRACAPRRLGRTSCRSPPRHPLALDVLHRSAPTAGEPQALPN